MAVVAVAYWIIGMSVALVVSASSSAEELRSDDWGGRVMHDLEGKFGGCWLGKELSIYAYDDRTIRLTIPWDYGPPDFGTLRRPKMLFPGVYDSEVTLRVSLRVKNWLAPAQEIFAASYPGTVEWIRESPSILACGLRTACPDYWNGKIFLWLSDGDPLFAKFGDATALEISVPDPYNRHVSIAFQPWAHIPFTARETDASRTLKVIRQCLRDHGIE